MEPTLLPIAPVPEPLTGQRICFDIEIANLFDLAPGEDLEKYAPFDISVAASSSETGDFIPASTNARCTTAAPTTRFNSASSASCG